jgi:hypothetical protein
MKPQDLDDEALNAVHAGAAPIWFKDRPRYYHLIAEAISDWREATLAMVKSAVKSAQREITRGAPADAD